MLAAVPEIDLCQNRASKIVESITMRWTVWTGGVLLSIVFSGLSDARAEDFRALIAPFLQNMARQPLLQPAIGYASASLDFRKKVQECLVWIGRYEGPIDGEIGSGTIAAIKEFQRQIGVSENGVLTESQLLILSKRATQEVEAVGFRIINDGNTGIRIGIPTRLTPQARTDNGGTDYLSPGRNVQLGLRTFKGIDLSALYERVRATVSDTETLYATFRGDWFVLSGASDNQKYYMRFHARLGNVAGFFIVYDNDITETRYSPAFIAMSSFTLEPFATSTPINASIDLNEFLKIFASMRKTKTGTGRIATASLASAPGSLWNHNNSVVKYVMRGEERYFVYEQPRNQLRSSGVSAGTVLFSGRLTGPQTFSGTAYSFKRGCNPAPYEVSGIAVSSVLIELVGSAPVFEEKGCGISRYRAEHPSGKLRFSYLSGVSVQLSPALTEPNIYPAPPATSALAPTTTTGNPPRSEADQKQALTEVLRRARIRIQESIPFLQFEELRAQAQDSLSKIAAANPDMSLGELKDLNQLANKLLARLDEINDFNQVSAIASHRIKQVKSDLQSVVTDAPYLDEIKDAISSLEAAQRSGIVSKLQNALANLNAVYARNESNLDRDRFSQY